MDGKDKDGYKKTYSLLDFVKICKQCKCQYARRINCSTYSWEKSKYCSRKCVYDAQIGFRNEQARAWRDKVLPVSVGCWLQLNYGNPNKCENIRCKKRSNIFYWTKLVDKPFEKKRDYFVQLCGSCAFHYRKIEIKLVDKP